MTQGAFCHCIPAKPDSLSCHFFSNSRKKCMLENECELKKINCSSFANVIKTHNPDSYVSNVITSLESYSSKL